MSSNNRGKLLEMIINQTLSFYSKHNLALFHRNYLPINFRAINRVGQNNHLKAGRILKKALVDYSGVFQGHFIAFEVKSTNLSKMPRANIRPHQHHYLSRVASLGGIAFYIIGFKEHNRYFVLEATQLDFSFQKSLSLEWLANHGFEVALYYPGRLDFLPIIQQWIEKRPP